MDIHDRVIELEARISKLETHLQRLVSMADPSLQPVKRVVLELDATRGQETAILELFEDRETAADPRLRGLSLRDFYDRVQRVLPGDDPVSALRSLVAAFEKATVFATPVVTCGQVDLQDVPHLQALRGRQ